MRQGSLLRRVRCAGPPFHVPTTPNPLVAVAAEESTWNLYTWGGNTRGQLGTGDYEPRKEPQRVTALTPTAEEVRAA